VLKIVMEELATGEIAAMYQEGEDAVIMVSRSHPDDVRCKAVNDLLASVRAHRPVKVRTRGLLSLIA
jgi:ribosomal protein L34E